MEGSKCRCKTCCKDFIDISYFYTHLGNVHHSTIICPWNVCQSTFSNIRSLQTHVSRDHQSEKLYITEDTKLLVSCPIKSCGLIILDRQNYLNHMPVHLNDGEVFKCCYPNCDFIIRKLHSFRSHVSMRHPITYKRLLPSKNMPDETSSENESETSSESLRSEPQKSKRNVSEPCQKKTAQCLPTPPPKADDQDEDENDPFTEYNIKDQLAKFYLRLEAEHFLPTSTVQKIADEISLITEFSHHHLRKSLKPQLEFAGLDKNTVSEIIATTFKSDPVYNTHHRGEDSEQFCSDFLRRKYWKKNYPYVEPRQVFLGFDENGRKKYAQYVSIRQSLKSMLRDPVVKKKVLESFNLPHREQPPNILCDITDGSAYIKHRQSHHGGKCLYINLFQDGCDNNAFGPTVGKYKPNNFYFSLGNLGPEFRTKLETIHLAYIILEKHIKNTEGEELRDVDKLKEVLKPLLDELEDLKTNGIVIDGERIPVCLLFSQGDNLGQHLIGGFVCSFTSQYCCRFCETSLTEFRENPTIIKARRTPEKYDESVRVAKNSWIEFRAKCLDNVSKRNERMLERVQAPGTKTRVKRLLAKSTLDKLRGIHHKGIKYRPSPFNSPQLQFHCCSPPLAPCISHDLWEGIAKNMLPPILSSFVNKGWFDLETLNRRIESFQYEGSDKADAPTRLKNLISLGGNASENWNLVRLLPLIIGDLIENKQDEMWCLFLKFKEIAEFVCAPKISVKQVLYLKSLIADYLLEVKRLLPECLYPKQHILMHYPELIMIFGPLSKVFTLRFESFHVFFKKVASSSRNFINFTRTLSRKYMCKFALDHSRGLLEEEEVVYDYYSSSPVLVSNIPEDRRSSIPKNVISHNFRVLNSVSVKGIEYKSGYYMVLESLDLCDLKVGLIDTIFLDKHSKEVCFLLNVKPAINTFQGYFRVITPSVCFKFSRLKSLTDYYPLPSYSVYGLECLSLKHSIVKMK